MRGTREPPDFAPPARFVYRYRWRLLAWILEGHTILREALLHAWPRAVRRTLFVTERVAEIPFLLRALDLPRGSRVLDVGSRWSPIPFYLSAMGFRTIGMDLHKVPVPNGNPAFIQADARALPFRPETFDGVTMVSTLEHIGIQAYDGGLDEDGDVTTLRALREVLRPGGILILTVPFGRPGQGRRQRVYDRARLGRIREGYHEERILFFISAGTRWQETSETEASAMDSREETRAIALCRLRRD